jgi:hypothetical protein
MTVRFTNGQIKVLCNCQLQQRGTAEIETRCSLAAAYLSNSTLTQRPADVVTLVTELDLV